MVLTDNVRLLVFFFVLLVGWVDKVGFLFLYFFTLNSDEGSMPIPFLFVRVTSY